RHHPAGRQTTPGADADQPDIPHEVVVDRLPLDGLEEVDLRRPRAPELAIEEVDHDLARELAGRWLLGPSFDLKDMCTCKDERLPGRAVDDRPRADADGMWAEDADPDDGLRRVGVGEARLGRLGLLFRAVVAPGRLAAIGQFVVLVTRPTGGLPARAG